MIPICKHCEKSKVNRPRGLCWSCYYPPGVKDMYPSTSKYARRGVGNFTGNAPVAARPQRKPAANGGLRPTASSLAIVHESMPKQGPIDASRLRRLADETLVRQDADFQIRLTSGEETRLVVSDPQGHVVFNDAIDTPEGRSRMPVSVRDRVTDMEKMLDGRPDHTAAATVKPTAEIGRLDVAPVELR